MTHISGLGLENFRVFKENTWFDFAPITVLTGPNSSGKSTVLKAIQLIKSNISQNKDLIEAIGNIEFMDNSHNLGHFRNCVNKKSSSETFGLSFIAKFKGMREKVKALINYLPKSSAVQTSGVLTSFNLFTLEDNRNIIKMEIDNGKLHVRIDFGFFIDNLDSQIREENYYNDKEKLYKEIWERNENQVNIDFPGITLNKSYRLTQEYCKKEYPDFDKLEDQFRDYFRERLHSEVILEENEYYDPEMPLFHYIFKLSKEITDQFAFPEITDEFRKVLSSISYKKIKEWEKELFNNLSFQVDFTHEHYNDEFSGLFSSKIPIKGALLYLEELLLSSIFSPEVFDVKEGILKFNLSDKNMTESPLYKYLEYYMGMRISIIRTEFSSMLYKENDIYFIRYISKGLNSVFESLKAFNIQILTSSRANSQRLYSYSSQGSSFNELILKFIKHEFSNESKELEFINKWLKRFEIEGQLHIEENKEGVGSSIFLGNTLLTDLGYGITQFLPILMEIACTARSNYGMAFEGNHPYHSYLPSTLYIEEPEINLHPKLQSQLADLFIEAHKEFDIQFIIETHSEYFIRKLQFLTAKGQIKPEETSIYYLQHPDRVPQGEQQVKKIEINKDGTLSDEFGSGFFDEADNLAIQLFALRKAQNN